MKYMADIHGNINHIISWLDTLTYSSNDSIEYLCILGDAGLDFHLDERDEALKSELQMAVRSSAAYEAGIRLLFVRGNHEARPGCLPCYKKTWTEIGEVYIDERYPDLYFLIDGYMYRIEGEYYYVIGGGCSKDAFYRILSKYRWFSNEQLTEKEFEEVFKDFSDFAASSETVRYRSITILSHMLPTRCIQGIQYGTNGMSYTEQALQRFYDQFDRYIKYWYAGHYHRQQRILYGDTEFNLIYTEIV